MEQSEPEEVSGNSECLIYRVVLQVCLRYIYTQLLFVQNYSVNFLCDRLLCTCALTLSSLMYQYQTCLYYKRILEQQIPKESCIVKGKEKQPQIAESMCLRFVQSSRFAMLINSYLFVAKVREEEEEKEEAQTSQLRLGLNHNSQVLVISDCSVQSGHSQNQLQWTYINLCYSAAFVFICWSPGLLWFENLFLQAWKCAWMTQCKCVV